MKTTRNALFALLLLGSAAGAASAQASFSAGVQVGPRGHASVDFGLFYDSLASYGNWIQRPSHGWVWTPRDVAASWRPYQSGHWVWSDEGWTWLTDEPYGWATYHYGRWYQDPEIGWAWVPGNDWAPAWVSWQEGDDSVGWAPLPPGANVNASYNPSDNGGGYDNGGYDGGYADDGYGDNGGYGYDDSGYGYQGGYDGGYAYGGGYGYGGGYAYGIAPAAYLFVPTRYFLSVNLFDFFLPSIRVNAFFGHTRNCTYYGYSGGRYFNRGVAFDHIQRYYGRVPRYQLSELDGYRGRGYRVDGNRVAFYRPRVERGRGGSPLDRPGARGSVVDANRFRADHPDRQRNYAQTYGRINGRDNNGRDNNGRNYGQNNGRNYGQSNGRNYGQTYGQNNGRNYSQNYGRDGQQRSYRVPQVQGQGQGDRQRQYQAPRVQQQRQYQAPQVQQRQSQQRQYQAPQYQQRQQRQYQAPQVQRPAERQRSYDAPRAQRQAPQQRENRGESRRGQDNRGGDNGHRRGHGGGN